MMLVYLQFDPTFRKQYKCELIDESFSSIQFKFICLVLQEAGSILFSVRDVCESNFHMELIYSYKII